MLLACDTWTSLDFVHITSIVGFAFSELLGFKLLPRLKNIGSARLYRPGTGEDEAWPRLETVLSNKTIDWDLIARHYDQMIKYATALRLRTAESHQMLRRFTRGGPKHPPTRRSRSSAASSGRSSSVSIWRMRDSGGRSTRA
ncbi:Tn3 transposase DDE domain-containing protein [Nonomuraea fuscirosea]|uniref:Tn3 transposase DDE domain-containing protein n=1 Tax=Nonomuraea fuscirosea TaxID=1291556 RepID=A0A2T0MMI3_9ACTN|nr:transposase [Nonomuraea fuscirosea]PRX59056.1 Tn3 transposase DDE domain-containing protein [Nonomuraea fuscirosea]